MTLISFAIGLIAGTPDKFPILALTSIGCVAAGKFLAVSRVTNWQLLLYLQSGSLNMEGITSHQMLASCLRL